MSFLKVGVAVAVVALAGCSIYSKPGASPQQVAQDETECDDIARRQTVTMQPGTGRGMAMGEIKFDCMKGRGY